MRFPWGKYRGKAVADVPTSYLAWLIENATQLAPALRDAIKVELAWRLDLHPAPHACLAPPPDLMDALTDVLRRGYRAAALQAHPDRGGDTTRMQELNGVRDWLRQTGVLA
jgi:hypothetical protein